MEEIGFPRGAVYGRDMQVLIASISSNKNATCTHVFGDNKNWVSVQSLRIAPGKGRRSNNEVPRRYGEGV